MINAPNNILKNLANRFAVLWVERGLISESDKDIYAYGVELLLSTALNLFFIISFCITFATPLLWVPYLIVFIPLRMAGGGYHAKTHLLCVCYTLGTFVLAWMSSHLLLNFPISLTACIVCLVSCAIYFAFAPISSPNKQLSEKERIRNRKISIILAGCFSFISIVWSLCLTEQCINLNMFYMGEMMAALNLIVGKTVIKP